MFRQEVQTYLWCRIAIQGFSTPGKAWAKQVVANGGAKPSNATISAMDTFYTALQSNNLLGKMISVVCFVPDNLIAATTPFIRTAGNTPWINHSFVAGDLNINGLKGDGATKYLDTGVFPLAAIPTDTSAGLTVYNTFADNVAGTDMGCQQFPATPIMQAVVSYADTAAYWDCWNTVIGQGRIWNNNPLWTGYFSCNRTAAAQTRIYRASAALGGHQLLANGAGMSPEGRPDSDLYCFAHADQDAGHVNTAISFTTHRLSFAAVHVGLSQPESIAFWTAIQALRTALGGGYV